MTLSVHLDAAGLPGGLAAAGAEISRIAREEIAPAASLVEDAFGAAARGIERELSRAARSGEVSFRRLAQSIARDLAGVAIDGLVRRPLETLLTGALSAPFGGARADGGAVARGQAYLVGERGPELFVPATGGHIGAATRGLGLGLGHRGAGRGGVNVTIQLPGVTSPESFRDSETQIAASLARVLSRGERNQ